MDEKINLNGKWYQVKDTFEGLSIKKIEGDCVILGEKKICLMKKRFWRSSMRFLWIICFCSIVYGNCENRLFNLSLEDASVKIIEVLNEFAKECYFSVIYKDLQTQKSLDKLLPLINFKQKT